MPDKIKKNRDCLYLQYCRYCTKDYYIKTAIYGYEDMTETECKYLDSNQELCKSFRRKSFK